ncbi:MAG: hypothetical protein AAF990_14325, partial [Bacteroidota bacterium]
MEKLYMPSSSRFTMKIWLFLVCAFCWCGTVDAQVTFWQDDFSGTGPNIGGGDRDASNHTDGDNGSGPGTCGAGDYFFRTSAAVDAGNGLSITFSGFTNSYWRGEDLNGCVANPDVIDFTGIDITGLSNFRFTGSFGANPSNSWESNENDGIEVEYRIDGGAFQPGIAFKSTALTIGVLAEDTDGDGTGDGTTLGAALQAFSFTFNGTGTTLALRITISADDGSEEFAFDDFTLEHSVVSTICPTIGTVTNSETDVCPGDPFNVTAAGLATMDMASNMEQDFGIRFVAFTSAPADPYVGGTDLGTVPFGSLTAGNTTAALVGATLATAGTYTVYAVLSPTPTDPTCRPSALSATLTVNAPPAVTLAIPANLDEFCVNDPVTLISLAGSPTGGAYSGSGVTDLGNSGISFTFDPAAAGVGMTTVTYTVTDMNGCTGSSTDVIVVNALPTVTFTAPADLCVNDGVQAGLGGGSPTGGVYSGAGVTDDGNGTTYSFDPAVAGVGVTTITYTFTDGSGCTGSASDDVEVLTLPNVTFTALADLCVDAGVQAGLGGGSPTGGVYSGAGVTDDGNGMTYSFDPAAAGDGVTTITYTVGVAGCDGMAMDDVEVFALPNVTVEGGGNFCEDDPSLTLNPFESPSTGGVYSGPGVTDDGNSNTLTFDPSAANIGTNMVVYTVTDANGCSNSASFTVTVNAGPTVTFTALADLCLNDGVQTGLGGGSPTGGVYSGAGVTDDGNGTTYSFDPAVAGVGVTTITYTFTDGNGCDGSASDDVEVFALPNVTFTALADLCLNDGVQAGLGGGSPTGGVYSGAGVIDDGNGMTYSFDPAAAGAGVTTITYTVGIAGCDGMAMDDVEVFALPAATLMVPDNLDEFCVNDPVTLISLAGSPTGGVYSGSGVTDLGNSGISFTFDPAAAGVGMTTVTYSVTDANGCTASATDQILVNDLPTVTFTALLLDTVSGGLCLNDGVQLVGGGSPTGGVYSGTGVTDNGNGITFNFDPAVAGAGMTTLTYTFTDGNGCEGSASDDIEVFALPTVTFTALADLCIDAGVQTGLGGGSPTGGFYSGAGVTDDGNGTSYSFDPAAAGAGVTTITYTFADMNGCSASASDDVEVFPLPDVVLEGDELFCENDPITTVDPFESPQTGVYSGPGVTDDGNGDTFTFDPSMASIGSNTIVYTVTDMNGCSDSESFIITINALPTVSFTAPADLCIDAGVQTGLGGGTPAQGATTGDIGVYSGPGVTDDGNGMTYSFDPATAGVGTHTITYTYTDENGCTNSASDDVEVFALPVVSFTVSPEPTVCIEDAIVTGIGGGTPTGGVYSGVGVTDDGNGMTFSFDPTASAPTGGDITVTYTFTDANGCTATATDDIFVNPLCCMPPSIACPPNNFGLPMGCNPMVPAAATTFNIGGSSMPDPALPTVTDGCTPLVLTSNDVTSDVDCIRTVERTYTVTDDNGDTATCVQTFTFTVDTEAPVFNEALPMDATVECDAIPAAVMLTAMDNCAPGTMPMTIPFVFINEIHYDNVGTDAGEFIEVA